MFVTSASPDDNRPAPFPLDERWGWVNCEEEGFEGFAIYVRKNLRNDERAALVEEHDKILAYQIEYMELPLPEREGKPSPRDRERVLIAPYIRDWNATGLDEAGNPVPVPPPAAAGPEVFDAIYPEMFDWIVRHVLLGYRAGKGVGSWRV